MSKLLAEVGTVEARVFAPSVAQELGHPWLHELMQAQWFLTGDSSGGYSYVRADIAVAMERETLRLAWLFRDANLKEQRSQMQVHKPTIQPSGKDTNKASDQPMQPYGVGEARCHQLDKLPVAGCDSSS